MASLRIFIFCTLGTYGLIVSLGEQRAYNKLSWLSFGQVTCR